MILNNDATGRFDWFGGREESNQPIYCDVATATTRIYSTNTTSRALGISADAVNYGQMRLSSSDVVIYGLSLISRTLVRISASGTVQGYLPKQMDVAISYSGSSPDNTWIETNGPTLKAGHNVDNGFWSDVWSRIVNNATGSDVTSAGNQPSPGVALNRGLHEYRQEVNALITNAAGTGVAGRIFMRDTNNGSRLAANQIGTNPSYTADRTYASSLTAGASSFTTDGGVLLAAVRQNVAAASVTRFQDITWDYRGLDNSSTDRFKFVIFSYGYLFAETIPVLKGTTAYALRYNVVTDTLITEATLATVSAYTQLETAQKNYDYGSSVVVGNVAYETIKTPIGRTGSTILLGSAYLCTSLTLDSAAASVGAISGSAWVAKVTGTYTGGCSGGTATAQGAVTLNGGTFSDLVYNSSVTTLDNITVTGTLTLAAGTYRLNNCTIGTIAGTGVTIRAVNTSIANLGTATVEFYSAITHTVLEGVTPKSGFVVAYFDSTDTNRTYSSTFVSGALTSDGSGVATGFVRYRLGATTYTGLNLYVGTPGYIRVEVPKTVTGAPIAENILVTADGNYTANPSTGTTINFAGASATQAGNASTQGIYDYYIQQWLTATNIFRDQSLQGTGAAFDICGSCTFNLTSGTLSGLPLGITSGAVLNVNGGSLDCGANIQGQLNAANVTVLTGTINMQGGVLDFANLTTGQMAGSFASGIINLDSLSSPTTTTLDLRAVSALGAGLTVKNDSNANIVVRTLASQTSPTLDTTGPGTGTLTINNSPTVSNDDILTNSQVQLYNVTQDTELDLVTLSSLGYSFDVPIGTGVGLAQVGDILRLSSALYRNDGTIYRMLTESAVLTDTGIAFTGVQSVWPVLETIHDKGTAYQGANVTGFALDVPNIQVDASITTISGWKLATWLYYQIATTANGMRYFFGAFRDLNLDNFEVDASVVGMQIDNTGLPANWIDASWTRSDGVVIIADESQTVKFANGLINLVAVSGTKDATIDEIKAKTDNLPSDPADQSAVEAAIAAIPSAPSASVIADAVWDEILTGATHNIQTSAGRRLRQVASTTVLDGIARGPGTGPNQIQLATDASAVNGAYDPSMIAIVDGTGAGQCRICLQYAGASKTMTVNRNWKVAPDATSEYIIYCHADLVSVNEGLAVAGGANTITLNSDASGLDDTYIGQLVFLVSGTGEDQVGMVCAYNGTTKVATVEVGHGGGWSVVPDTTTAYVMMPSSPVLIAACDNITADVAALPTLAEIEASGVLAREVTVSAVKAKTDSLSFTVPGQVDANIHYVDDDLVTGDGTEANPWNPA
jgi:hypothetical protein